MDDNLIKDEDKRIRRLRLVVDLAMAVLTQERPSLQESVALIEATRRAALALFPDKADVYDLIYAPRFRRIMDERFTMPGTLSGRN